MLTTTAPVISAESAIDLVYSVGESLRRYHRYTQYLDDATQEVAIAAWQAPHKFATYAEARLALVCAAIDLHRSDARRAKREESYGAQVTRSDSDPAGSVLVSELRKRAPIAAALADGFRRSELTDRFRLCRETLSARLAEEARHVN